MICYRTHLPRPPGPRAGPMLSLSTEKLVLENQCCGKHGPPHYSQDILLQNFSALPQPMHSLLLLSSPFFVAITRCNALLLYYLVHLFASLMLLGSFPTLS